MAKTFMGVRLRSLRAERGMTQAALAQALGLSPSYLNQIEQDQRPLTVAVLLKIHKVLGVDIQQFSEDEEARLLAQLRDALAAMPQPTAAVPLPELREVATRLPQLAQALLAMHQRHVADVERLEALTARLGDGRSELAEGGGGASALLAEPARQMPFEAVRDFFFAHRNHFDALDRAAETLATQAREQTSAQGGSLQEWLQFRLQARHQVLVLRGSQGGVHSHRRFDAATRTLYVAPQLRPAQQAFQLATQLALLEFDALIEDALKPTHWQDEATRRLARMGLANYVAGAFVLPYGEFLQAAESLQYDVDLLARRFGVGFETVCHRLSTLQRAEAPGVPFFFIRVDRAGNISKRQSARISTSPRPGAPARCGWCTRPSPSRAASCPSWPACPTGGSTSGLPAPSAGPGTAGGRQARPFPSAWAATCSMRRGWCIPRAWTCVTWRLRPPSAWAARSASAMHARNGRSPLWASRCV